MWRAKNALGWWWPQMTKGPLFLPTHRSAGRGLGSELELHPGRSAGLDQRRAWNSSGKPLRVQPAAAGERLPYEVEPLSAQGAQGVGRRRLGRDERPDDRLRRGRQLAIWPAFPERALRAGRRVAIAEPLAD